MDGLFPVCGTKIQLLLRPFTPFNSLYESMLDTVLVARDKYLKPGGTLFPDKATIYIAAIEDEDYKAEKINCKPFDGLPSPVSSSLCTSLGQRIRL